MWRESKKGPPASRKRKVIDLATPTAVEEFPSLISAQVKRPKSRETDEGEWRPVKDPPGPPGGSIPNSPRPVCSVEDLRIHSGKVKEVREALVKVSEPTSETFVLLLSGPPGSGKKTTLGLLAAELGIPLIPVDVDVELRNLRSVEQKSVVTLTDVMKFLTTEGNLVRRREAHLPRPGILLQNIPVGAEGTPRQEGQKNAIDFLNFTNSVAHQPFFIAIVLTEDASHHTRMIWNLREGIQPKTRLKEVHFNSVADSQVKSALRLAVAPLNAKKSFKLPKKLEEVIEIIVECCEKDLRQARIKLTRALSELSITGNADASSCALVEISAKDQVMSLFRFLGRCLYGKRISWSLLQAEGLVSEEAMKHLQALKRIIECLPLPPPCPRLEFGPRPWRLSARLEEEAQKVHDLMHSRMKASASRWKSSSNDEKSWYSDLLEATTVEDDVIVSLTPDPPRAKCVQLSPSLTKLTLEVAKGRSRLENADKKATQEGPEALNSALTKPPIYFDPGQHLRAMGVTNTRAIPGMLARSAPELLTSLDDLAQVFAELSRIDIIQSSAWNDTDEEANIDMAEICCLSALDASRQGVVQSRGMTEFRRALDKDIKEKREARSKACSSLCGRCSLGWAWTQEGRTKMSSNKAFATPERECLILWRSQLTVC